MKRKEYNNGFKQYYYKCEHCGSESISETPLGGFQPPLLICDECGRPVPDNPTVLYYEDNSELAPKVDIVYSEKEVEELFRSFFIKNIRITGDITDLVIEFPKWFEENKKK